MAFDDKLKFLSEILELGEPRNVLRAVFFHKLSLCLEELVLTMPEEFENRTLFPRLGLLFTLIYQESELFDDALETARI